MEDKDKKFVITPLKESKEINSVLSNDTCRLILDVLADEPLSSSQLSEKLHLPLSTVDDNIKKLAKVGLIDVHHRQWSPKGRKVNFYKPKEKFIILAPSFGQDKILQALKLALPIFLFIAFIGAGLYWDAGKETAAIKTTDSFPFTFSDSAFSAESDIVKQFNSYDELKEFAGKTVDRRAYGGMATVGGAITGFADGFEAPLQGFSSTGGLQKSLKKIAPDYSRTNVQVEGVDEADIVKTDGKYIYLISNGKILIAKAYPPETAKVLSEIEFDETPTEIFVNGDKLVVFGSQRYRTYSPITLHEAGGDARVKYIDYDSPATNVFVYDITDRTAPRLTGNLTVSGTYFDSRMIGDHVYFVSQQPISFYDGEVPLPIIYSANKMKVIQAPDIYYFDVPDSSYSYSNIVSIDLNSGETEHQTVLTGVNQNMFVSENSIYMAHTKWLGWDYYEQVVTAGDFSPATQSTVVHRISISNGEIRYRSTGEVPGTILNQFSMDEYENYFRIATTSTPISGPSRGTQNNVYVLDSNLDTVGKLEGLAEGEKIYSVRFMGEKVYLVTFRQIDPFYVIDLGDPRNPEVLGYLKLPGFSDYLHPYDENHIIGIGKDATEEGRVKGMKLSLFDVSDVSNPVEISKYYIGGAGTDSEALRDHKAFLFSKSKNLLVIPVTIAEDWSVIWEGAYAFNLDTENGFVLKGGISHRPAYGSYGGYSPDSGFAVRRSLYIEDALYTISGKMIKVNALDNLQELKQLQLYYIKENIYGGIVTAGEN